ncbi:hypothetical protein OHS33_30730 [Streptomyces sp. NBC_00536]|uniref:hypothetical protein n=1 Tax=Streptomyces sp. NBC_00536 TaxID=2975769 RepID=UPI002E80ABCD|nr:hypothetical protein [Streptomyces sp. NBC_00536]WUC82342.1 hypothetical protein OHS33_30730 [Streptomyces sp. NBC_00536]
MSMNSDEEARFIQLYLRTSDNLKPAVRRAHRIRIGHLNRLLREVEHRTPTAVRRTTRTPASRPANRHDRRRPRVRTAHSTLPVIKTITVTFTIELG